MLHPLPILTLDDTAARSVRATLDGEHADRVAAAIKAGRTLPPVLALQHGDCVLVYDGAHRLEGHRRAAPLFLSTLEIDVEITGEGGPAEALALALGCNQEHGLPLSRADLRHRRELVLTAEEERVAAGAKRRSSRALAEVIGCSHTYVSEWYSEHGIETRRRKPAAPATEAPRAGQQLIGGGEVTTPPRDPRRLPEAGDMLPLPDGDGTVRVVGVRRSPRGWDVTVREHSPTGTPLGGTYGIPILEWWDLGGVDQPGSVRLERDGLDRVLVWRQGVQPEYAGRPVETLEQALALLDERRTGPSLAVLRDRAEALLAALVRLGVETFELPGEPLQDVGLWLDALSETPLEELQQALPAIDAAIEAARTKETPCPDLSPPVVSPASPFAERAPGDPLATDDDCDDSATSTATPTSSGPTQAQTPWSTPREDSASAGPPSGAFPATTERDEDGCDDEDAMLGEALDEAREQRDALQRDLAIQTARADGWQRIAEAACAALECPPTVAAIEDLVARREAGECCRWRVATVDLQHRLDAAIDRERQALARAERAEADVVEAKQDAVNADAVADLVGRDAEEKLGELRSLLADLAELFGCAPTRAELAPRAADAAEAWRAREPVTPEELEAIRERFLAASGPAQGESDDPAMAIYRSWTRSADELAAHLEALPREDWEQVRQAFGVASGARIIERLTMRIMRGARAA